MQVLTGRVLAWAWFGQLWSLARKCMGWATPVHPVHPFAGDRPEGIDIDLNLRSFL